MIRLYNPGRTQQRVGDRTVDSDVQLDTPTERDVDAATCYPTVNDQHVLGAWLGGGAAEAVPLFERTLAMRQRMLGPDDAETLTSEDNLASACQDAGRIAEAIRLYEQSLEARERLLGPDHPRTLTSRGNLAAAYRDGGRIAEAIALLKRTVADRERLLGPDHPDSQISRKNLANAYRAAGRAAEAVPLFERTLAMRQRMLGPDDAETLTSEDNLASACQDAGRIAEAIRLYEQSLEARERLLGPDHPRTLTSRGNLAAAYRDGGRIAEAIALLKRTVADRERLLGPDHPDSQISRKNLANAYRAAGRAAEAIPLEKTLVGRWDRVLGPDHPDTQASPKNLATANQDGWRVDVAIPPPEQTVLARESQPPGGQRPPVDFGPLTRTRRSTPPSTDATATESSMQPKRLLAGLGWNTAGQFLVVGISLGLTPFLLHHLGATLYGIFALVSSVRGLLSNLDGGLAPTGYRYFPVYVGQGDVAVTTSLLLTMLTLVVIIVGAVTTAMILVAPAAVGVFALGSPVIAGHSHETVQLIRVLMPALFIAAIRYADPTARHGTSSLGVPQLHPSNGRGGVRRHRSGGLLRDFGPAVPDLGHLCAGSYPPHHRGMGLPPLHIAEALALASDLGGASNPPLRKPGPDRGNR